MPAPTLPGKAAVTFDEITEPFPVSAHRSL